MKTFNRPWLIIKDISVRPIKDGIVEARVASPYYCLFPDMDRYAYPGIRMLYQIGDIVIRPARLL